MMTPWELWKKGFYAWEKHTAEYMETVLKSPAVLTPGGYMLSQMMKGKASTNKAMTGLWGTLGLPTKHDQERMLHAINQLQSHVYDLQEQLEDVKNAKK